MTAIGSKGEWVCPMSMGMMGLFCSLKLIVAPVNVTVITNVKTCFFPPFRYIEFNSSTVIPLNDSDSVTIPLAIIVVYLGGGGGGCNFYYK